jgi:glycosyltransferase involved in cell wall biosynthesis
VAQQTFSDWELIVVDDGSTDNTDAVVQSLDLPDLHYIRHEENRGAPAARNRGAQVASGALLAFLDSDDAWLPIKLQRQVDLLDGNEETDAVTTADTVIRNGRPEKVRFTAPVGDLQSVLTRTYYGVSSSLVCRRSAFEAVGGFDERLRSCQDWDLLLRLSRTARIQHVTDPLVRIYASSDEPSITRTPSSALQGYRQFLWKHRTAIAVQGPGVVAEHEARMARLHVRDGRLSEARSKFRSALQHSFSLRYALHWAATLLGRQGYLTLRSLRYGLTRYLSDSTSSGHVIGPPGTAV